MPPCHPGFPLPENLADLMALSSLLESLQDGEQCSRRSAWHSRSVKGLPQVTHRISMRSFLLATLRIW